MSQSNHPPRKPVSKLENLNSLYSRLIKRLEARAAELGLPKNDLFFCTTKESIFALKRGYELSIIIGEEFVSGISFGKSQ